MSNSPFPPPFPPPDAGPAQPSQVPNAVAALVLGILSIVFCPLCGPVAWALGRNGEQAADAAGGTVGGRGLATAGKVLGMIGTLLLLLIIAFVVWTFTAATGGSGTSGFV